MLFEAMRPFFIDSLIQSNTRLCGSVMAELGSQNLDLDGIEFDIAKYFFKALGVNHYSFDVNNKYESIYHDFNKPIDSTWYNNFDIITNFGTSEHIDDQYQVFNNLHLIGKVNCLYVHNVPIVDNWPGHCLWYYPEEFAQQLCDTYGYKLIDCQVIDSKFKDMEKTELLCFSYLKGYDTVIDRDEFDKSCKLIKA